MGDFAEGVVGEEGLVAGDEDVGEGKQAGKQVVLEDLGGAVFKKEAGLLLVDVDGEVADVALLQAADDGGGVENSTAAGVDEKDALFHLGKGVVVDQVPGGGKQGNVEGENVEMTVSVNEHA